jgi:hypothetical protein
VGMHIDASQHGPAHMFGRHGFPDTGGMVVYQVFLKLFYLFIVENHFRKLANTGIDAVHNFAGNNFFLQHGPACLNALNGIRMQINLFSVSCDINHILNGQAASFDNECHDTSGSLFVSSKECKRKDSAKKNPE